MKNNHVHRDDGPWIIMGLKSNRLFVEVKASAGELFYEKIDEGFKKQDGLNKVYTFCQVQEELEGEAIMGTATCICGQWAMNESICELR